jgi:hypothetical protein
MHICKVMKGCLVFYCVLFFGAADAQLLDNAAGSVFTDLPFFNVAFVKSAKIKEIRGKYTFKKQGDILRNSNFVHVYSFDTLGRLTCHYKTAKGDGGNDTTVYFYNYSPTGQLLSKRINEKRGFLTTYYTYDSLNRVIKEEVFRDIDTMHSKLRPEIERSLRWNSETMAYDKSNGQLRKKIYNSYGNLYLEHTKSYDTLGFLKREEDFYTITHNSLVTEYNYGDKAWISRIATTKNADTIPITELHFTYDNYGNLLSKSVYKNGVFVTEYQVIYSTDSGLLSSVIMRDVATNFITIIRFDEVEFWDRPKLKKGR